MKETDMPAVLIGTGYVTNLQEEKAMLTEDVQRRIAASILEGIKEYLKLN
ncbi:N-acetylmuramoyl-L-alanine amidase family protein [Paenibacillus ginsengarvi]|uniref:MurNAc-LAA domain-containing protein n=1 Tax=Paenibacillus ginsengarvi TaxID=400777 RepID=A0A3B0CDD3_9BACL|nr:N-acetylmuramoyl-L-alanine amidase [Paenibacillus ginsengarvi]RKN81917.1 hypothetical protein D7M11_18170 [Paenibacillus ginsengarvi]